MHPWVRFHAEEHAVQWGRLFAGPKQLRIADHGELRQWFRRGAFCCGLGSLTTLNANLSELDDEDAKALAPAIASSGSLAELNSSHNQIRAEGIIALAPAINISWNRIFSQGAAQELLAAMKGKDMKRIMRDAWVARRSGGSGVCEESEVEQTAV